MASLLEGLTMESQLTGFKLIRCPIIFHTSISRGVKMEFYKDGIKVWEQDLDPMSDSTFQTLLEHIENTSVTVYVL